MKKGLLAALLAVSLLLCSCGEKAPEGTPDGMQLASGADADYSFWVPDGWKVESSSLYSSAFYSSGDATSMSVTAYGMKFTDSTVRDWWETYKGEFEATFSEVSLGEVTDATLGGIAGMRCEYSAKLADTQYKYICYAAVKDNYVYYLLYTSTPDYYENHLNELEKTVLNFSFK